MKISGFSFVRNAVTFDYPFLESISSILPLCDEFVIAVGKSSDDTLQKLESLNSPKIKLIETVWDESLRTGGEILAQQTNIALDHVSGNWAFYLQADEVVHENDFKKIRDAMVEYYGDKRVEGILFSYKHFYGSYRYIGTSRQWYRNEIRIVRTGIGVRSWGDAQGFRIDGRKLRVKPVDSTIYHYGWVKPPEKQQAKQQSFNRLWHSDGWVKQHVGASSQFDYNNGTKLTRFTDSHPAVMQGRIKNEHWNFEYDASKVKEPLKDKVLDWIEAKTGMRIGEYRNYDLIK
ncbi:MAG: glycosyltransferase family 2 protein [Ignavibacteriales bacterium]|nr:glycosyltransferase family 2 protein [Ignavibacteriales bacterium]